MTMRLPSGYGYFFYKEERNLNIIRSYKQYLEVRDDRWQQKKDYKATEEHFRVLKLGTSLS